jgi:hypothetical protein
MKNFADSVRFKKQKKESTLRMSQFHDSRQVPPSKPRQALSPSGQGHCDARDMIDYDEREWDDLHQQYRELTLYLSTSSPLPIEDYIIERYHQDKPQRRCGVTSLLSLLILLISLHSSSVQSTWKTT